MVRPISIQLQQYHCHHYRYKRQRPFLGQPVGLASGQPQEHSLAAQTVAETAAKAAMEHGLKSVEVYVKGPGSGREAAIRALQGAGLEVNMIRT